MAALTCEICGGKLIGKPGGVFECDSCGMEYSTEWAKAKIQEIKGTVKVEGTVEVTGKVQVEGGTVQVEGTATKENLLKRGELLLADANWEGAAEYFNKVLDLDPESAEAYLGLVLANRKVKSVDGLVEKISSSGEYWANNFLTNNKDYQKVKQYGSPALLSQLQVVEQNIQDTLKMKKEHEEKETQERERASREQWEKLRPLFRSKYCPIKLYVRGETALATTTSGKVMNARSSWKHPAPTDKWDDIADVAYGEEYGFSLDNFYIGLKQNGTVIACGKNSSGQCNVGGWRNIIAVAAGNNFTVGLKRDGSVLFAGYDSKIKPFVSALRNVTAIEACNKHFVCLKSDGTVAASGDNSHGQCNVSGWRDIIAISTGYDVTVGLKSDGTAVMTGNDEKSMKKTVSQWTDLAAISAWSANNIVGVTKDGKFLPSNLGNSWKYTLAAAAAPGGVGPWAYAIDERGLIDPANDRCTSSIYELWR